MTQETTTPVVETPKPAPAEPTREQALADAHKAYTKAEKAGKSRPIPEEVRPLDRVTKLVDTSKDQAKPAAEKADGPARAADGKFTSPEKEPTPEKATNAKPGLTGLERAKMMKFVPADKLQSVIDLLGEDVVGAWNAELAADQSTIDKLLRQRAQSETQADPEENAGSPAPLADLAEEFAKYGYSPEEQELFARMYETVAGPAQEAANTAIEASIQMAGQLAITRLEAEFPELSDPAVREKTLARARKQWEQTDEYDGKDFMSGAYDAVRDAAAFYRGRAGSNVAATRNRLRDASQPRLGGPQDKNLPYQGMKRGELTYKLISEGHTPKEAAAIASDLGVVN